MREPIQAALTASLSSPDATKAAKPADETG